MKAPSISARERRTVVAGASVAILMVVSARVIPAFQAWRTTVHDDARKITAVATDARRLVGALPAKRDSLAKARQAFRQLDERLMTASHIALIGAQLAGLLSEGAESAGVKLGTMRVTLDSTRSGAFGRVAVQVDGTGDVQGLTLFLTAIEGAEQLVSVRSLSIDQPNPAAPADRAETLRFDLVAEAITNARTSTGRKETK